MSDRVAQDARARLVEVVADAMAPSYPFYNEETERWFRQQYAPERMRHASQALSAISEALAGEPELVEGIVSDPDALYGAVLGMYMRREGQSAASSMHPPRAFRDQTEPQEGAISDSGGAEK